MKSGTTLLSEQVRPQHAEQLLAGIGDVVGRLPLTDGRLGDPTKAGDGGSPAELLNDGGCVHAPILRELCGQRNKQTKHFSEHTTFMLKDRLRRAMDGPPRVSQIALARACGVTGPAVNDWLSGKTKTMRGEYLMAASGYLGVSPAWLASGRGPMRLNGSPPEAGQDKFLVESGTVSQPAGLDRAILHEALTLLFYDEMHAGDYTPHARTDRLAELYGWVEADGGRLSATRNAAFVQQVTERNLARSPDGATHSNRASKSRAG